jgi:3-dehydroquinate synthetase
VLADEREAGARISLNLGHTLGHALEAAAGFERLLHGEAVAYGVRAAARIGEARGVTPPDRAARIERLLDALELGMSPTGLDLHEVLGYMATDKKHAGGALRWVLPTADGYAIDAEVQENLVREVAAGVIAGHAGADVAAPEMARRS